jgi:predicted lipase
MITNDEVKLAIQCMINSYHGKYGKVVKIFDNPKNFKIKIVEGFYAVLEDTVYIVYQGSKGKKDWLNNFKFWQKDVKTLKPYGNITTDIEIHTGFYEEYNIIRPWIHALLNENPNCQKIRVYGHSLGASISTLCAVDIQFNYKDKDIHCITGGSPRVGNQAFVDSYNRRVPHTLRIVNGKDIVTKVPPKVFDYRHVSKVLNVGPTHWYKLFSIEDHYPQSYLSHFEGFIADGGKLPEYYA